jgi:hypothetical protein
MASPVRITRVDGAVLADCLYLIGQAMVKFTAGDDAGADEDLAAAYKLVPPAGVNEIMRMARAGEIPPPDPAAMDEWLEACRMAGSGELVLFRILFPSARELAEEEREAFLQRLDEVAADAERRMAAGELQDAPPAPKKPGQQKKGDLDEPGALTESLRRMGLL